MHVGQCKHCIRGANYIGAIPVPLVGQRRHTSNRHRKCCHASCLGCLALRLRSYDRCPSKRHLILINGNCIVELVAKNDIRAAVSVQISHRYAPRIATRRIIHPAGQRCVRYAPHLAHILKHGHEINCLSHNAYIRLPVSINISHPHGVRPARCRKIHHCGKRIRRQRPGRRRVPIYRNRITIRPGHQIQLPIPVRIHRHDRLTLRQCRQIHPRRKRVGANHPNRANVPKKGQFRRAKIHHRQIRLPVTIQIRHGHILTLVHTRQIHPGSK